jgi:putative Mn2+ efflux pump MntP
MFSLIVLSLGLAMDAVAVSLVRGASGEHKLPRALEVGMFFGIAQGLMPLVGWSVGALFSGAIAAFDHWVAFALLGFLGTRMLAEAVQGGPEDDTSARRSHYAGLTIAAIATSIDAAAAGITLPLLEQPVALSCLTIGLVTGVLCVAAYWLGTRATAKLGKGAEIFGGLALIALGVKILVEHLGA